MISVIIAACILCSSGRAPAVRQIHPPINLPVLGPPVYAVQDRPFSRWQSREIVDAFKEKGLEVMEIKAGMFVGAPWAKENTIFLIPSFGKDIGSLVSSFDSVKSINESAKYYSKMNDNAESPVWWIFKKDNILVLISRKVPEKKAVKYEDALMNIKGE